MQASFQLLDVLSNKLVINTEGLLKLKQLRGRIFVVATVGSILTGKSSLLNCIAGREVFKVGQTTMPTTKGIWAYVK
jgi:ribosome biogenesis GTPase A